MAFDCANVGPFTAFSASPSDSALAAYELARTSGAAAAYEFAAHALARALRAEQALGRTLARARPVAAPPAPQAPAPAPCVAKPRAVKAAPSGPDLAAPLKAPPQNKRAVGAFVVSWADGSETQVRAVTYHGGKPDSRWAAAFQAADRLRRARARHAYADSLQPDGCGAPILTGRYVTGPNGIKYESPEWRELVAVRPMSPLHSIAHDDSGETFTAPDGSAFGAGDAERARVLESSVCAARCPWLDAEAERQGHNASPLGTAGYGLVSIPDQEETLARGAPGGWHALTGWTAQQRAMHRAQAIDAFTLPAEPETAAPGAPCAWRSARELDGAAVVIDLEAVATAETLAGETLAAPEATPEKGYGGLRVRTTIAAGELTRLKAAALAEDGRAHRWTLRRAPGGSVTLTRADRFRLHIGAERLPALRLAA